MTAATAHPSPPEVTAEDRARHARIRADVAVRRPELNALGRAVRFGNFGVADAITTLKQAREADGVSLAELARRTGIDETHLTHLENAEAPDPTAATLTRYAEALGRRMVFAVSGPERTEV